MNVNENIYMMTQKLKLKDLYPDAAEKIAKKYKKQPEDIELIRKGITPSQIKIEEGERASIDYITTDSVDRDGEIVMPNGAVLNDYKKHPVVLFGHDYSQLPIGKSEWIKKDEKGLIAKTVYATHEKAEEVWQYRKAGFPLAKSIGFVPLDWEDLTQEESKAIGKEGARRIYKKWLMLEYSDVSVPSNPDALQIAIGKGLIKDKTGIEYYQENAVGEVMGSMLKAAEGELEAAQEIEKQKAIEEAAQKERDAAVSVWIKSQMGWLLGARNDIVIADAEKNNRYNIYAELYKKYEMEIPELKEYTEAELKEMFHDVWFEELGDMLLEKMAAEDEKEIDPLTLDIETELDGDKIQEKVEDIMSDMEAINQILNGR